MNSHVAWELPALDCDQPTTSRVRIVLGRTSGHEELNGQLWTLDRAADAPVEIEVDGHVRALGEVVVVDGKLAIRVTQMASDGAEPSLKGAKP